MLELSREGARGHARFRLGVRARSYWDHSEINAVDRFVGGELERLLTPRLAAFTSGHFDYYPERDEFETDGQPQLAGDRPDWKGYGLTGGLRYALDAVSTLTLSSTLDSVDYGQGDLGDDFFERDRRSYLSALAYERYLSERDAIGITVSYADDWFDEAEGSAGEETSRVVSGIASWSRAWSESWSTSLGGGVRWASLHQDELEGLFLPVPGIDLSPSDRSFGFVGSAGIERKTSVSTLSLAYGREISPTSGYGGQADVDTLSASYERRLAERLTVRLEGFAQRYESAGDTVVPGRLVIIIDPISGLEVARLFVPLLTDSAIDARLMGAGLRLDWRLRKHWSTFLRYGFLDQQSDGDRAIESFDAHRVTVGFRYALPIDLR